MAEENNERARQERAELRANPREGLWDPEAKRAGQPSAGVTRPSACDTATQSAGRPWTPKQESRNRASPSVARSSQSGSGSARARTRSIGKA